MNISNTLPLLVSVCVTGDGNDSLIGQIPALEGEEDVCGAHYVCVGILWGTIPLYQGE